MRGLPHTLGLANQGHPVGEDTIRRRLRELDYSLQAKKKNKEGEPHADRDRQFRYTNRTAKQFLKRKEPVIDGTKRVTSRRSTSTIFRVWQRAPPFLTDPMMSAETRA